MNMKKTYILFLAAVATVSSCGMIAGSVSSDNGQRFQDGIYNSSPSFRTKEEKAESKTETDALVAKTKESQIYLFGDKKDTVMIPQNMSARIQFNPEAGGTVVTVGEDPYGWWNGYTYAPYSIGSSWYWSRHYSPYYSPYWGTWGYRPWRYYGFYDPWYYGGFYDPWYYGGYGYYGHWYGGFYDPWYYGGWYDPWYCGGYWGWHDPHHHHHRPSHIVGGGHRDHVYHGLRAHTERRSVVSTGSSSSRSTVRTTGGTLRGGMSVGNTHSRSSVTRRPGASTRSGASVSRPSSSTGSTSTTRAASSTNYRRPSHSGSAGSSGSYTRGSSQSSQSYTRGSSSYDRSSGYSRSSSSGSSSYSRSSSSYGGSSSGYSRSSSSGGGSYSRSSSGGYRR